LIKEKDGIIGAGNWGKNIARSAPMACVDWAVGDPAMRQERLSRWS